MFYRLLAFAALVLAPQLQADDASRTSREAIVRDLVGNADKTWRVINNPKPTLSSRDVFGYALVLCEANVHLDRLDKHFELAAQMQDRDPKSRSYGNFRWSWGHEGVFDWNAVDFCMQQASLIWLRHQDKLPASAKERLRELLEISVQGLINHRVAESYTNIALMNAGDLILLGEALDKPDAVKEGCARLDRFLACMWEAGTHEYCSPTYYGTDLDDLAVIEHYAKNERAREQARTLLEYFWTDIALNWFPPAQKLAGARSRDYDYLRGIGYLHNWMWSTGWAPLGPKDRVMNIIPALTGWRPLQSLKQMSETRFPRLVQQIWGFDPEQYRTHYLCSDVTLSTAGACYHTMDIPLSADLPSDTPGVRCYFIPDGRHDPYGKVKIAESKAHSKTLHLKPFWTAAQRREDALGLVVYREKDLGAETQTQTLESHFVMPIDVDGFWIGSRRLEITKDKPFLFPLKPGQALILKKGTVAVGVRVPLAKSADGSAAPVTFVFDGNSHGAVRLTATHQPKANAAAAFWVRIGSELKTESDFEKWRDAFTAASAKAEATADGIKVNVSGAHGAVSIATAAPFVNVQQLVPPATRALLACDGEDIGKQLLQKVEPIKRLSEPVTHPPVNVPADKGVAWEAETGRVWPAMTVGEDNTASGGKFVWMPAKPGERAGSPTGNVTWQLNLARGGDYYLWGRVLAPSPENDSFNVRLFTASGDFLPTTVWATGIRKTWTWVPVALQGSRGQTVFALPQGSVNLQFRVREAGTQIDRLFLTPDKNEKPN